MPRRGLTLVEVAFSTLLVGLLFVGALRSVGAVWQTWRETSYRTDRTALAHELLEEVLDKPLLDPQDGLTVPFGVDTSESSTTRSTFDDVDDYDNWSATPPQDLGGTPRTAFAGWTRTATVEHISNSNPSTVLSDGSSEQGVRRITVTVTDDLGKSTTLVAIRGLMADVARAPDSTATTTAHVGVLLRVGAGEAVQSKADVRSEAFDR